MCISSNAPEMKNTTVRRRQRMPTCRELMWSTCSAVRAQQTIGPLGHWCLIHQVLVMSLLQVLFRHSIRGHIIPVSIRWIILCWLLALYFLPAPFAGVGRSLRQIFLCFFFFVILFYISLGFQSRIPAPKMSISNNIKKSLHTCFSLKGASVDVVQLLLAH